MYIRKPILKVLDPIHAQISDLLVERGMVFHPRRIASIHKAYCDWTGEKLEKDPIPQMLLFIAANKPKERVARVDSGVVGLPRTFTFKPLQLDRRLQLMFERAQYQPTLISMLSIKEQHRF